MLWDQLHAYDAQRKQQDAASVDSKTDTDDKIDASTSSIIAKGGENGAIFDETVAAYTSRREAGEDILVGTLVDSHTKALRAYTTKVQWTTIGESAVLGKLNVLDSFPTHHLGVRPTDHCSTDDPAQFSITPELDEPLRVLKTNFDFLSKAMSTASFRRVWHGTLDKLQDLLWTNVLLRQSFTTLGAAQFLHDVRAIFALIEHYIPGGSSTLEALREGLILLNLPAGEESDEGNGKAVTLKQASDRAFRDNDEARKVIEELQLTSLTPVNARNILQRRVENNENIGW